MRALTAAGQQQVTEIARRHGFGAEAGLAMMQALIEGGGEMAQFRHPEFGGMGQWTRGGMVMLGDMFNNALKARVDALCTELAALLARQGECGELATAQSQTQGQTQGQSQSQRQGRSFSAAAAAHPREDAVSLFVPGSSSGGWWPDGLGAPAATGAQNDIRYAWFPSSRRLAIHASGRTTVYDTGDHRIGGVSQQQSGDASLTFTSQHGLVRVAALPVVPDLEQPPEQPPARAADADAAAPSPAARADATGPVAAEPAPEPAPPAPATPAAAPASAQPAAPAPASAQASATTSAQDILGTIERLAELRDRNILSEAEFAAKKAELLARL